MCISQITVTGNVSWRHSDVIECQICDFWGYWSHYLDKQEINQKLITVFTF